MGVTRRCRDTTAPGRTRPRPPILEGILPIVSSRLPMDIVAGATLAALAIPEVMGYTKIAGTPVITGLYTLLLPVLLFALFGSSRHLVVGADSATAAIMATGLLAMGLTAESTEYVGMASLTAILCMVFLIAARVLKLGFIANFLSRSVLIGFLTGVGIQVAMGQVGGMFGISGQTGGTIEKFLETLRAIPTQTSVATLAVSLAVLATIVGLGRVNKKIPGALLAVVGAILLSYVFDLASRGVTTLGPVPGGLPAFGLPPASVLTLENVATLLPTVFSLFIVILAQSAATSRAYAMRYGDRFDENVDLVGLGLANLGAGVSGTFVVNGSPTKTEMVDSAGGRSQVAQLTCGAIVVAVLLFLTGPLSYMPNAVLAAVVFLIGLKLVDIKGMSEIARLRPGEFAVAVATAFTVIVVGVEQGIILAMVLSVIEHISHSYRPHDTLVSVDDAGAVRPAALDTGTRLAPGVVAYRFGANLYYANSTRFTEEVMALVEGASPPVTTLIIVATAIGDVDYSGADALRQIHEELDRTGIAMVLADVDASVRAQLDAYGLIEVLGSDNVHGSLLPNDLAARYASAPSAGPASGEGAPSVSPQAG